MCISEQAYVFITNTFLFNNIPGRFLHGFQQNYIKKIFFEKSDIQK